ADVVMVRLGLDTLADRRTGFLSGGQRRRLDLATALVHEPRLLVLDEPTTGLDPQTRRALWAEIAGLAEAGTTVLLTTQYMEEAGGDGSGPTARAAQGPGRHRRASGRPTEPGGRVLALHGAGDHARWCPRRGGILVRRRDRCREGRRLMRRSVRETVLLAQRGLRRTLRSRTVIVSLLF